MCNKGAAGVDMMEVDSFKDYLVSQKDALICSILGGRYHRHPTRRVFIPKGNGMAQHTD
jgi:retron-type reverse transcriptase